MAIRKWCDVLINEEPLSQRPSALGNHDWYNRVVALEHEVAALKEMVRNLGTMKRESRIWPQGLNGGVTTTATPQTVVWKDNL